MHMNAHLIQFQVLLFLLPCKCDHVLSGNRILSTLPRECMSNRVRYSERSIGLHLSGVGRSHKLKPSQCKCELLPENEGHHLWLSIDWHHVSGRAFVAPFFMISWAPGFWSLWAVHSNSVQPSRNWTFQKARDVCSVMTGKLCRRQKLANRQWTPMNTHTHTYIYI